jgi:hypothetical protein
MSGSVALYVQALAEPTQRQKLLAEASTLFARLPAEMHAERDVQRWQARIQQALQGRLAENGAARAARSAG